MKFKSIALALVTSVALVAPSFGTVLISIDITGANDPVDSGSSRTWNFSVTQSFEVSRSIFSVKRGSQTDQPIIFSLYSGLGGTGDLLRSYSLAAASEDTSYDPPTIFDFENIVLTAGNYSATLTSTTGTSGAFQYFLKNGAIKLYNDNGSATPTLDATTELSSSFYNTDGNTSGTSTTTSTPVIPEPSSLSILAITGLLALRRRRA